jgi:hypothetical protein
MLESILNVEVLTRATPPVIVPKDVSHLIKPNLITPKEGNNRHNKILLATSRIISDAKSLYDVPPLPDEYYPEGDEGRSKPRNPKNDILYRPVWSELEDPQAVENWAKQAGFENLADLYEEIPYRVVLEAFKPVPKIEQAIWTKVNYGKVRMNLVLEVMRGYQISQMLAEQSYENGMDLLRRHLPDFVPQEPSYVIGDPSFIKQKKENGEYFGKVNGKHVLVITTPLNPYLRLEDYRVTDNTGSLVPIIGAHELMHQKHAEISDGLLGFNPPEGSVLTLDYISTHTPSEIDSLVKEEAAKMNVPFKRIFGEDFALDSALAEGIATGAELFIDFAEARRLMRLGLRQEAEMFIESGKIRRKMLKDARGVADGLHYAVGTEEIVEALFKSMNMSELGAFLANVDLNRAANIRYGTPAFKEILEDPKKLPQKKK